VDRKKAASVASLLLFNIANAATIGVLAIPVLAPRPAAAEAVDKIVLRINDEIATLYDYQKRKEEMIDDINRRERDPAARQRLLGQAGEIVFKDLYEELLLRSRANQLEVEITDDQIDRAVQQMKDANGIKTDQDFQVALTQAGLTLPKLRDRLRSDLRLREVLGKEVNSKVKIDEEDLRRYYRKHVDDFRVPEQIQVKEAVVLETAVPSPEERLRIAAEIKSAIAAGKTFEQATEPYRTKGQVGALTDLGWVSPGDLEPGLEKAGWSLEKGAVSNPVAGRGGVHLLQVLDRHESHIKPFNEVSAAIQAKEEERVYREKLAGYMADLQKQSLIVADPPAEAAGFRSLLGPVPTGADELEALRSAAPAPPAAGAPGAATPPTGVKTDVPPGVAVPTAPAPNTPGALPTPKPVDPNPPAAVPPPSPPPPPGAKS
jgi:peptidyl-prolyl cis-trans isomerase SurA